MTNRNLVQLMNQMILDGKMLEAFETFYADDVVMQENDQPPTVGKAANRERELAMLKGIVEFRAAKVLAVGDAGEKTFVEWFNDFTHGQYGVRKGHQVAVQTWKDGKIVHERFYYGA